MGRHSNNRGGDDRLGKHPNDGRGDRPGSASPTQVGIPAQQQGAPPQGTFSHPDDEPHPSEKPYGEPVIPMMPEAELAGVLGASGTPISQFQEFQQAQQQSVVGVDRTLGARQGAAEGPYRQRDIGDMQYDRPGGEEDVLNREASGHERDDFEYTDEQRLDMFRLQMFQNSLPQLPPLPGFHVCWLTTTNPRDTIRMRMTLGYKLLQASDFPGWDQHGMPGGEFAGAISVNEMVAAALPIRLYQMYMKEAHHDAPLREEGKLRQDLQSIAAQGMSQNVPLIMDPHTAALGLNTPRQPRFS